MDAKVRNRCTRRGVVYNKAVRKGKRCGATRQRGGEEEEVCGRAEEGSGEVRGGGGVPPRSLKGVSGARCNPGGGCAETEGRAHPFRTLAPVDRLRQNIMYYNLTNKEGLLNNKKQSYFAY